MKIKGGGDLGDGEIVGAKRGYLYWENLKWNICYIQIKTFTCYTVLFSFSDNFIFHIRNLPYT